MKTLMDIFEDFSNLGSRVAFRLKDGSEYEGYMLEFFDHKLLFGSGGPLAPEEPFFIYYNEIDLDSLSFYCEIDKKYKSARWDTSLSDWIIH